MSIAAPPGVSDNHALTATFDRRLSPFPTQRITLANRIVMAPMTRSHSPGRVPGPDVAAYYRRRAEGGVGLIITEGTYVDHPAAGFDPKRAQFSRAAALQGWRQVAEQVHAGRRPDHSAALARRYGGFARPAAAEGRTPIGPSGFSKPGRKPVSR